MIMQYYPLFIVGFIVLVFSALFCWKLYQSIRLVPTKSAYVIERLGKYHKTLDAGFHILFPFIDKVVYIHDLKEEAIEIPSQECFSCDEVNVEIDGVIYISVINPKKASYGVMDYRYAAVQLAQSTTRSVIGTLELDRTFEEREIISAKVIETLDKAGTNWGIRVHRYEIKNITPPDTVKNAMEMQVNAEREGRALLAKSEGDKQSMINRSEGMKTEMINISEGEMQRRINEAQGKAEAILELAKATAESIDILAQVISSEGGKNALKMQLGEQYLTQLEGLSRSSNRIVLPANIVDYDSWMENIGLKQS